MMNAVDRLSVIYEVDDRRYRDGLRRMEQAGNRTNRQIVQQADRAEKGVTRSFRGVHAAAAATATGILAIVGSLKKLADYSQRYKIVENRLRSIGEYSDEAAEKLSAAAIRSRADLEDMATTVARIQKATGDGYDTTIRRVETLNKLLAVGGATASEVNSVVVQLSQALSSGVLQGDELRSLREAAPVELLDAIAKAAGVTRAELKDMGAEGRLTSAIIVQALDELATSADEQFGRTSQTIGQAMTNIQTGLVMFAGRLDEGFGATEDLTGALDRLGVWLNTNAGAAEEFGRSITAALQTGGQYAQEAHDALMALADTIHNELVDGSVFDLGESFADTGMTIGEVLDQVIQALAKFSGVMEGSADAAREAFLKIPDAITSAMQAAINAVIGAVEAMINKVLEGVRTVAQTVDDLTAKIPGTDGTNLAGGIGSVSFGRVDGLATSYSSRSVGDAYGDGYARGEKGVLDAVDSVEGFFEGIRDRYHENRAELERQNREAETTPPGLTVPGGSDPATGNAGSNGKKGGKGRTGREERPFFEAVERDLVNLERQMQLIGKTAEESATLQARWQMLDEAKKRGIPVNETLNAQIDAQASQVGRLTGELERAEIAQQQFDQAVDGIADAFAGALVAGESLRDGLAQVFKQIASDILNSGIRNALTSVFGGSGFNLFGFLGGGDKLSGALRGAGLSPSFAGGGFTGHGSRSGGIDGHGGFPAILHPNETVIDHTKGQRVGGGKQQFEIILHAPGGFTAQQVREAQGISMKVVQGTNRRAGDSQYLGGGR